LRIAEAHHANRSLVRQRQTAIAGFPVTDRGHNLHRTARVLHFSGISGCSMMRSAEAREARESLLTAASIDDTNSLPHAAGKQVFGARLCSRVRHVLPDSTCSAGNVEFQNTLRGSGAAQTNRGFWHCVKRGADICGSSSGLLRKLLPLPRADHGKDGGVAFLHGKLGKVFASVLCRAPSACGHPRLVPQLGASPAVHFRQQQAPWKTRATMSDAFLCPRRSCWRRCTGRS
jgi:hypothetical protein